MKIPSEDTLRLRSVFSHLKVILTAPGEDMIDTPSAIDQSHLLVASGSFRSLFAESGNNKNILTEFSALEKILQLIRIECIETNCAAIFLSNYLEQETNVSDAIVRYLIDSDGDERLNEENFFVIAESSTLTEVVRSKEFKETAFSGLSFSGKGQVCQEIHFKKRILSIDDWLNCPICMIGTIKITRKKIIEVAANELGGIHYNVNRIYDESKGGNEYRKSMKALDWADQVQRHSILSAIAIMCVELRINPYVMNLFLKIGSFLDERDVALKQGYHARKNTGS